jgi:hypothetical protein
MSNEFKPQHARFTDTKGGQLEIRSKQMKNETFQVVAYHQPKGQPRSRGCLSTHAHGEDATKRFAALCAEAEKNKWVRRMRKSSMSAFDAIPKA